MTHSLKILQFGEGNFLRAFVDWMVQGLNDAGLFDGDIRLVQPISNGMAEAINRQNGRYTVLLRGIEDGRTVRSVTRIDSVLGCLDPYEDWNAVVRDMQCESLRFIVSNTTEAGIQYREESFQRGQVQETFPAKLTSLLYERFQVFGNTPGKGLLLLPCELIENNGGTLKSCVLRYAGAWNLEPAFVRWIETENFFLSTLVDRIVTGFPAEEYEPLCREFGYEDRLVVCGESFHFFAIEAAENIATILSEELPLARAGFNVLVTENIKPYRDRKVRFLNGAHTSVALAAHLAGFSFVHEVVADPVFSEYLKRLLFDEISPTVDLPETEKRKFAESVLERFSNPFIQHRLTSIALNSVSKWSVRVLPSLLDYYAARKTVPPLMVFSLAALVVFYRDKNVVKDDPEIVAFFERIWNDFNGNYVTLVDAVLRQTEFWRTDLSTVDGFRDVLVRFLKNIDRLGIQKTLAQHLQRAGDESRTRL